MTAGERIALYENALANIMKLYGESWEGRRRIQDPQYVAEEALRRGNPKYHAQICDIKHWHFYIDRSTKQLKIKAKKQRALAK